MVKSVFVSTLFSLISSALSYLLIVILTRAYSTEDLAQYIYVMTLALLCSQVIDCVAEQCLVHFSKTESISIQQAWHVILRLKGAVLAGMIGAGALLEMFSIVRIPALVILCIIPAFYLSPVFEAGDLNMRYSGIATSEKVVFFLLCLLAISVGGIELVICAYFIASAASLLVQAHLTKILSYAVRNVAWRSLKKYLSLYSSVYFVLLSQLLYGNVSRLIVEAKQGAILFASISLSLQLINSISIVQTQVDRHVRPVMIEAVASEVRANVLRILGNYLSFYVAPLGLAAFLVHLYSQDIVVLLFSSKWRSAADVLALMAPLLLTIPCMRMIDMMVVPLKLSRLNLTVNIFLGLILFALLWFNPWSAESLSYAAIIVGIQALHVVLMAFPIGLAILRLVAPEVSGKK